MIKRRNLAMGGLAIAGISYLAGILTAPKSGRETRKDLKRAALKTKTELERKLKKTHSELSDLIDEAAKKAKSTKAKIGKEFSKAISQAKIARQKSRELLSAIHEGEAADGDLENALEEASKALKHLKQFMKKPVNKKPA